jgi:hypothetical protein
MSALPDEVLSAEQVASMSLAGQARRLVAQFTCKPCKSNAGWVYAIGCPSIGMIKIGKAVDPIARLAELERMNAAPLVLLGLSHGLWLETTLHRRYAAHRHHGEWFKIDENPLPDVITCTTCRGPFG